MRLTSALSVNSSSIETQSYIKCTLSIDLHIAMHAVTSDIIQQFDKHRVLAVMCSMNAYVLHQYRMCEAVPQW